jgi:drug/metabolite transporter (DMT)-like permease
MVATAPLMLVLGTLAFRHRRPPLRVMGASVVAFFGVLFVLTTAGR